MLRRRAAFIASVTLACAALSLAYALLATPKYVASGRIILDAAGSQVAGTDAASRGAADATAVEVENQIKVMTSRSVFDKVIAREKLETDPLFGAKSRGILPALLVGIGFVPPADPRAMALRQLERAVSVMRDPGSFAMIVSIVTSDRETSARVANAVMEFYVGDAARVRPEAVPRNWPANRCIAGDASGWLAGHRADLAKVSSGQRNCRFERPAGDRESGH